MTAHPNGQGLLALLAHGLVQHSHARTTQTLGDRRSYVGMSDIGKGITCLRSAVASKLQGGIQDHNIVLTQNLKANLPELERILGRELVLQRGHWLEAGVEAAFTAARVPLIAQVEIASTAGPVPLRAHPDFIVLRPGRKPAVRIVELKSTGKIPSTLYPAYEAQLYGQLGLLKKHWTDPAFSLRNADGSYRVTGVSFPALVRSILGIDLPNDTDGIDLDGFVLCLSMAEARAFGPYRPSTALSSLIERTAKKIWTGMQAVSSGTSSLNQLSICPGFHPLCDHCPYFIDCPKYTPLALTDPAVDTALEELTVLKDQRKRLDSDITVQEERIRTWCRRLTGSPEWLQSARFRFKTIRMAGRKTVDSARLRSFLSNHLPSALIDTAFADASKQGTSSERLSVIRL